MMAKLHLSQILPGAAPVNDYLVTVSLARERSQAIRTVKVEGYSLYECRDGRLSSISGPSRSDSLQRRVKGEISNDDYLSDLVRRVDLDRFIHRLSKQSYRSVAERIANELTPRRRSPLRRLIGR